MSVIIVIPALVALWYLRKSPAQAFFYVYMTVVLVMPNWPRGQIPTEPTFNEAAMIPIAAVFFIKGLYKPYQFSIMDLLVFLLLAVMECSEYVNAGFPDARHMLFDVLGAGLFPYLLAKCLVKTGNDRTLFGRRFVWCLFLVWITTLYEFRFAYNPYRLLLDPFFPGQGAGWVTTFRYGFPRVAGPYGHAILNGIVTLIGVQFAFWLKSSGAWEPKFRIALPIKKANALLYALLMEAVITFTRGPQLGTVMACFVAWIGRPPNPKARARWVFFLCVFLGIPVYVWFQSYASVGRAGAKSEAQETVAYRKDLMDKYVAVALEHGVLGWGTSGWPTVNSMRSIDNYYLLLALMHGVTSTVIFVLILLTTIVRLFRNGMRYAPMWPAGSSLSFCLLGTYCGLTWALASAYLGENVAPIFFMLCGFTDGYLVRGGDGAAQSTSPPAMELITLDKPEFQRVIE